jgi:precorrin-2 dehydrogenase / sirohydrochlorin ferrochelatase
MQPLPLFLDLAGRRVLLVGGGTVAETRLASLLPTGAELRLVAKGFREGFRARAAGLELHQRPFRASDLDGVHLAVAATNDPAANAHVAARARARGIWVNAVDDPPSCDVTFASTLRRGPWTLALSTGGAFPGLSRSLRRVLEDLLPGEDLDLLEGLAELRTRLKTRLPDPAERTRALRHLLRTFEATYFGLAPGDAP